jgi:uncharacterized protein
MKKQLLDKLCCPFDKADLELTVYKQEGEQVKEGVLSCASCSRYYPIVFGVPIMSPDEYREKSLEAPILKRWGLQISGEKSFKLETSLTVIPQSQEFQTK